MLWQRTHGAPPTIQDGKLRSVIEYTRQTHALLLASTQHIFPLLSRKPAALACGKICKEDKFEDLRKLRFRPARLDEVCIRVRVNDPVHLSGKFGRRAI
jgi:hypothetical protein